MAESDEPIVAAGPTGAVAEAEEAAQRAAQAAWSAQSKHLFVLSFAGRPIYTRHGDETDLSSFMALVQAVVSFCDDGGEQIRSVAAGQHRLVFEIHGPIYLLAVSRSGETEQHLRKQLHQVYMQMLFLLSAKFTERFESSPNFDVRSLLGEVDALVNGIIEAAETTPTALFAASQVLPVPSGVRSEAARVLAQCGAPNTLYAILTTPTHLVALVQPKNKAHALRMADLLLVQNFVRANAGLRSTESWMPLCMPHFNASGFLHAYTVFLDDDVCLMLVSTNNEPEQFMQFQTAKGAIEEGLRRNGTLAAIAQIAAADPARWPSPAADIPEVLHFVYRADALDQCLAMGERRGCYADPEARQRLWRCYQQADVLVHEHGAKLFFDLSSSEALLAVRRADYVLYAAFSPLVDAEVAMAACSRLLRAIKREEELLFVLSPPTW